LAYLFLFCKLAERILVEFGVDSNSILSFAIIAFAILLAALPINALNKRYSLAQNRKNEHDLLISKKQWIKNNLNDERWKQYGYSLFIFCPYGRLKRPFSLEWNECYLGSLHIGFYDKGITTRDQLLKVDKAIRELRKSLCYNVNKYVYVTILTIIALLTFTLTIVLIMKYGEQLPYFSFEGNLWGLNIFPTLIYYFAPTLVVTFCFDYIFYKMNQSKLRKWMAKNPTDWRKKYVMYKNYFDYKKWKESQ
jgi:uncharacterized membrane protein